MNWRVDISYEPGMRLVQGDAQEQGVHLKLTDPWGNEQKTVSGTKPWGGGGFAEFYGVEKPVARGLRCTVS